MAPDRFAYGANQACGCACPALAAGVPIEGETRGHSGTALHAAEEYDEMVKQMIEDGEIEPIETSQHGSRGVIPADVAREVWRRAVEKLDDWRESDMFYETAYLGAREVEQELGWD